MDPRIEAEIAYRRERLLEYERSAHRWGERIDRMWRAVKSRLAGGNRETAGARGSAAGEVRHTESGGTTP